MKKLKNLARLAALLLALATTTITAQVTLPADADSASEEKIALFRLAEEMCDAVSAGDMVNINGIQLVGAASWECVHPGWTQYNFFAANGDTIFVIPYFEWFFSADNAWKYDIAPMAKKTGRWPLQKTEWEWVTPVFVPERTETLNGRPVKVGHYESKRVEITRNGKPLLPKLK